MSHVAARRSMAATGSRARQDAGRSGPAPAATGGAGTAACMRGRWRGLSDLTAAAAAELLALAAARGLRLLRRGGLCTLRRVFPAAPRC